MKAILLTVAFSYGVLFLHAQNLFTIYQKRNIDKFKKYIVNNPSSVQLKDENGCTILHLAVRNSSLNFIKAAIEGGANVNEPDNSGMTPLMYGARNTNQSVIEF
jgi:ankyrin repeat protein